MRLEKSRRVWRAVVATARRRRIENGVVWLLRAVKMELFARALRLSGAVRPLQRGVRACLLVSVCPLQAAANTLHFVRALHDVHSLARAMSFSKLQ